MSKKLTTEEFIQKATLTHGSKYDYSSSTYTKGTEKLFIYCKIHSLQFEQVAASHIAGQGCPKCGIDATNNKNTNTTSQFIKKANIVHNKRYMYTKANYTKAIEPIVITCPHHGDFTQRAIDHLSGNGCQVCANNKTRAKYLHEPTVLYYVYFPELKLYKIGITLARIGVTKRFHGTGTVVQVLKEEYFIDGEYAYNKEQEIIKKHSASKYTGSYELKKGGTSECFTEDILNLSKE